jgi:hypothetical protein
MDMGALAAPSAKNSGWFAISGEDMSERLGEQLPTLIFYRRGLFFGPAAWGRTHGCPSCRRRVR